MIKDREFFESKIHGKRPNCLHIGKVLEWVNNVRRPGTLPLWCNWNIWNTQVRNSSLLLVNRLNTPISV